MSIKLSEGSISIISVGGYVDDPVMQILGVKRIAGTKSSPGLDRFRLLVSDGKHLSSFSMLATQLNDKVMSGDVCDYSVVQMTRYITSMVKNIDKGDTRVMVILDVKILAKGSEVGIKLGNPRPITETNEMKMNAPAHRTSVTKPTPSKPTTSNNLNVSIVTSPEGTAHCTHPIASLSPYQNKWIIKVRVISKSPVKTWSNPQGEGELFSMDLMDESGEIHATAFNEQCDLFFDMIEENKIYLISGCLLKTANKMFISIKNDYEMTFTNYTKVVPCNEDCSDIPSLTFNFMSISQLVEKENEGLVDVIGVCKSCGDVQTLFAKTTNRELKKRDVTIVDESDTAVNLTLWGKRAEEFDGSSQPVLAVKRGRINKFGGSKSISLNQSSVFLINPDIQEAHRLRGWFDNIGTSQEQLNISVCSGSASGGTASNLMTLREAKDNQLGCGDKPYYFSCVATVLLLRSQNALYKACPIPNCNKKVIDQNNGMYRCEKCNREYPNFKHRLLISTILGDATDRQWVTCFQNVGEILLGKTSQEVGDTEDVNEFQNIFTEGAFKKYLFRLRAKMETFNDENRLKVSAVGVQPIPFEDTTENL